MNQTTTPVLTQMEQDILAKMARGEQPNIVRGFRGTTLGGLRSAGLIKRARGQWVLTPAGFDAVRGAC